MSSFALFNTQAEAAARLTAENAARNETYFSQLIDHSMDSTYLLAVDDTFDPLERLPHPAAMFDDALSAAATGFNVDSKDLLLQQFAEYKTAKTDELIAATHAYEQLYFSGPAYSTINSLNDLSYMCAIHENDGAHLSETAMDTLMWINALWKDYFTRKGTVLMATSTAAVDAVSTDFSNNGNPPHEIFDVQQEYGMLLATIAASLPNVPQSIKDHLGLP